MTQIRTVLTELWNHLVGQINDDLLLSLPGHQITIILAVLRIIFATIGVGVFEDLTVFVL